MICGGLFERNIKREQMIFVVTGESEEVVAYQKCVLCNPKLALCIPSKVFYELGIIIFMRSS